MIKNIKGQGRVCYIQMFMEIRHLVPKEKIFMAPQNMWVWMPSGHVTNIFISLYIKVYV